MIIMAADHEPEAVRCRMTWTPLWTRENNVGLHVSSHVLSHANKGPGFVTWLGGFPVTRAHCLPVGSLGTDTNPH